MMAKRIYDGMEKQKEWFYNEKIERGLRMSLYRLLQPRRAGAVEEATPYITRKLTEMVSDILKMHRILVG
mgnify:CR=1 FL=1